MAKARRKAPNVPETPVSNSPGDQNNEAAQPDQIGERVREESDPATEFNPAELERQTPVQERHASQHTHAESVTRKPWPKMPEAFGIETIIAGDNVVHLYRSDKDRAFLIRMDKNPNEGRAHDDPHPALIAIKEAGFRWSEARADGKKAWGKRWQDGQFHFTEERDARELAKRVAALLGPVHQLERIPD